MVPFYESFVEAADVPTRAMLDHQFEVMRPLLANLHHEVLQQHEARIAKQIEENFVARHGMLPEQMPGFRRSIIPDADRELKQWMLTLLWLNRDPKAFLRWRTGQGREADA